MTTPPGLGDALPHLAKALEDVAAQLAGVSAELRSLSTAHPSGDSGATGPAGSSPADDAGGGPRGDEPPRGRPDPERANQAPPIPPSPEPAGPGQTAGDWGYPPAPGGPLTGGVATAGPYPQPSPYAQPYPGPQQYPAHPGQHQPFQPYRQQGAAPYLPAGAHPPPRPRKPPLSERLSAEGAGSKLLAWIGGGITLVGVVLLLVLAIQRGWIGPVPRVALGAVLATALIGVSLRVHRGADSGPGAFALAATGFAALYLDVVAATTLLDLVPVWLGLLTGLVIAGAGLTLAGRWNAQPLAIFVLASCAVFAPMITLRFDYLLVAFLLVLQVATTPLQLRRDWRAVPLVAGIPPLLAALIAAPYTTLAEQEASRGMLIAVVASLLSIGVAVLTTRRRPTDPTPVILLLGAPAPTLLTGLMTPDWIGAAGAAVLAVPLVSGWAYARFGGTDLPARFAATAGALGALCVFEATALLLPGDAVPIGLLGEAIALAVASIGLRGRGVLISGTVFAVIGTLVALRVSAEPRLVLVPPTGPLRMEELLLAGLTFALVAGAAAALAVATHRLRAGSAATALWLVAGAVILYGTTGTTLTAALAVSPDRTGFLAGHAVVTVSWTVAALVLLLSGIHRTVPRVCGLVLVGLALAKLVLFDLSSLDGIARAAAFLGAGLVLLGAGTRYARLVNAERERRHAEAPEPSHDTEQRQELRNP